jgi:methyl-accepting chemotaxis protein
MLIKTRVRLAAAGLISLLLIGSAISLWQINTIRMGGPIQRSSMQVADLVADILPPPEYVLEPYLEATLLLSHPEQISTARAHLDKLHKAYSDRHDYWAGSTLRPDLRDAIAKDTHAAADRFWQELEGPFLQAIARKDMAAARQSYDRLSAAYADHRTRIDALVQKASAYQSDLAASSQTTLAMTIAILFVIGTLVTGTVCVLAWYLLRHVTSPLDRLSGVTSALSEGEARIVPLRDRPDELGSIARAVERFRAGVEARALQDAERMRELEAVSRSLGNALHALSEGDLGCRIAEAFPEAYAQLRENFNEAAAALNVMLGRVNHSSANLRTSSGEIAMASEDLAQRTETAASKLQEASGALQRVDALVRTAMRSAEQTMSQAEIAREAVAMGRTTARSAANSMERVSQSAQDIDTVVEGLDKIAFQTRVLAMNAAVEAGRAGEAGRGFAVVADLVSALAQRAEGEAGRVRDLIGETQSEIAHASAEVERVDSSLAQIVEDFASVYRLLETMRADNRVQADAVTEITGSIVAMEAVTQQNAAMVEETSAAARALSSEVAMLSDYASAFRTTDEKPPALGAPIHAPASATRH